MKCIIFVVMLALAAANASVLAPYPYAAYGALASPWAYGAHLGAPLALAPASLSLAHAPLAYAHAPRISLAQGVAAPLLASPLAPISYAAHVQAPAVLGAPLVGHAASYTAATRGAVHTAPLPGHVQSVVSTNAEPAPGTL